MNENPPFFEEDGIIWTGSRTELEAWKAYKQRKALAFVERGYSVEWYRDGDGHIAVYVPQRSHAKAAEIRADIKCCGRPSPFGIEEGMIDQLFIERRRTHFRAGILGDPEDSIDTLFEYDRGYGVDRLAEDPVALALYHAVIEELN